MNTNLTELREVTVDELRAVEGGVDITPFLQAASTTTLTVAGSKIMANAHEMKKALIGNLPR